MNKDQYEKLMENLPGCPGIMGRDDYFRSAILVAFTEIEGELHYIFELRAKNIRQGGEVSFPGGAIDRDLDQNSRDTALRETCEELGLRPDTIEIDGQFDTIVTPFGACVDIYFGKINARYPEDFNPSTDEVERLFTVPVKYFLETDPVEYGIEVRFHPIKEGLDGKIKELLPARELGLPERYQGPWYGGIHPVLVYQTDPVVWGMTAMIVREISNWMKKIQQNRSV